MRRFEKTRGWVAARAGMVAVVIGLGHVAIGGGVPALAELALSRDVCVKLALEKKALETGGVKSYLGMAPADVAERHGPAAVAEVRHYIALSEKVLFQCPMNVLNAAAAALDDRENATPPLPVKGPRRAQLRVRPKPPVPLPVKKSDGLGLRRTQG